MAPHESQAVPEPTPSSSGRGAQGRIRALSLDPGGTTGYAICDINKSITIGWDEARFNESELTEFMELTSPDVLICEDFEYRNRARAGLDLTPPRLIGVVKLFTQSSDTKLILQKAAVGKGHYSDTRLKSIDLYRRGTPHGRDALRHLLHWLTFKGGGEFIDFVASDFAANTVEVDFFLR